MSPKGKPVPDVEFWYGSQAVVTTTGRFRRTMEEPSKARCPLSCEDLSLVGGWLD